MYKIKEIHQLGEWDARFWHGRGAYWTVGWNGRYSIFLRIYHFPYLRFTPRFKGRYGRYDLFPSIGITTWSVFSRFNQQRFLPFTPPAP